VADNFQQSRKITETTMQCVIFIGIQATGKSTFFLERFYDTHIRISLDVLRTRNREKILLNACLQSGQKFVVDNTNPTIGDRQRYIVLAKEAKFEVIGYYFESNIADSLQRNRQRQGKKRIPEGGIRAAYHKLQIPMLNEGFDQLFYVSIDPQGSFMVEEWQDEV
jgi:predicted kinase